jgi:hypothetical protein
MIPHLLKSLVSRLLWLLNSWQKTPKNPRKRKDLSEKGSNPLESLGTSSATVPTNVIFLQAYVEKNFWSLVNKGHFKDIMQEADEQTIEFVEEYEPALELGVPANDSVRPNPLEISLEELYDEEYVDLLTHHGLWEEENDHTED